MKIVRLTAENVKRLKAVQITPSGDLVTITGRNAQGKTSVLDAIWLALGGGLAARATTRPVRAGADRAQVTVDLGDLVVTRTWVGDKTTLRVTSADGARYPSPQAMLETLVGRLSFDPLAFTRLPPRDQVAALADLVHLDVDLDVLAGRRSDLYAQRTEVGRSIKAMGAIGCVDPGVPLVEQHATAILDELTEAVEQEKTREDLARRRDEAGRRSWDISAQIERLDLELKDAQQAAADFASALTALPEPADLDEIRQRLADVEQANRSVRENNERRRLTAEHDQLAETYQDLSTAIDELDQRKQDALAGADFPVEGLGFDETGVTYLGLPFAQASAAEQIRVSLAMAMALNPKLRVIRILDGSLLDPDNLALIAQMAGEQDYQIWIERVADETESAVVIEDGQVATPEAAAA